jgi:hypothetical protein
LNFGFDGITSFKMGYKKDTDFRIYVKLFRGNYHLGTGEFLIPQSIFNKKETNFKKWVTIVEEKKTKKVGSVGFYDQIKLLLIADITHKIVEMEVIQEIEPKKITVQSSKNKEIKKEKLKEIKLSVKKAKIESEKNIKSPKPEIVVNKSISKEIKDKEEENGISNTRDQITQISRIELNERSYNNQAEIYFGDAPKEDEVFIDILNKNEIDNEEEEYQLDEVSINSGEDNRTQFEIILNEFKQYYNSDYLEMYILLI